MWRVRFVTFLGRMWRSRTRKYFFDLVTFFVTSFPKNVTFWPRRNKTFLNGKEYDDSAGTEKCFSLHVSDLSLNSEAWSGKAISAKTDPVQNSGNGKENAATSDRECRYIRRILRQTRLKNVCYIHWLFHGQAMLAMSKRNLLHLNWDFEVDLQIRFQSSSWPSNRRIESWSSGKATQYWHGHYHDTWQTLTRIYFMKSPYEGAACHLQWCHMIIADKLSAFICKLNWVH